MLMQSVLSGLLGRGSLLLLSNNGGLLISLLLFLLHGLSFLGGASLVLAGLRLFLQQLGLGVVSLLLVDELNQHTLVLVHVTFAFDVELVVDVTVDLLLLTVLLQKTTEDALTTHPQNLCRHTSLAGSAPLSGSAVTTLPLGGQVLADAGARVDNLRLADDKSVLDQLPDVESGVGHLDLIGFIRIQPDLVYATLLDRSG